MTPNKNIKPQYFFVKQNLTDIAIMSMEILNRFPCIYRMHTKIASLDCYCKLYDRWVRLRYCMICQKRKWSQ